MGQLITTVVDGTKDQTAFTKEDEEEDDESGVQHQLTTKTYP